MSRREPQVERRCAFCGRPREEVKKLVAGPGIHICDRCIGVCRQLLTEEKKPPTSTAPHERIPKPKELAALLDEYVVGQDRAKRMLTVAVYNHLKRISVRGRTGDIELTKGNMMLVGPPGTGKTHLARTLARILNVPFAIADATPLTQAGYVGEDVESIIGKLLRAAGNDPERAATGIIYLDEVDKLAKRVGHDRDVSGEGVQQGLLKILEGKKVVVRSGADKNGLGGESIEVDTSNILFIAGGAFAGLAHSIAERQKTSTGFHQGGLKPVNDKHALGTIEHTDLHKYGFLPEFVGRFPVVVSLDHLDEEQLVKILTGPKDAIIKQYQKLFSMENARLDVTHDGLLAIARMALKRETGARGLRAVMEELLLDTMFDLPSHPGSTFQIDGEAVTEGVPRMLEGRSAA